MGRPSVQKQRRAEVLDAFLTLVSRYGIEGATLERIAEESGFKRPLIRHHLGNRDDMVRALAAHVVQKQRESLQQIRDALAAHPGLTHFVDGIFSDETTSDSRLNNAYQALVNVVEHYPDLRDLLLTVLTEFYDLAVEAARAEYPDAGDYDLQTVGRGIVDLYLTVDVLSPLNPPEAWAYHSYFGAVRLARSLAPSG